MDNLIDYQQLANQLDDEVSILKVEERNRYQYVFLNDKAAEKNSPDNPINKTLQEILPVSEWEKIQGSYKEAVSTGKPVVFIQYREESVEETKLSLITNSKDGSKYLLSVTRDITEEKHQERKIRFLENNDPITKLPNKSLLESRLATSIQISREKKSLTALLYIYVDGFQSVHDYLGHSSSVDQLLIEAIGRINGCFEGHQTLARTGSQGFSLLISDIPQHETAVTCAKSIIKSLEEPFHYNQHTFQLTSSIGITYYEGSGETSVEELLKQAELAMYMVKRRYKNHYVVYKEEMQQMIQQQINIGGDIQQALNEEDFFLEYQPIVDMRTNRIKSVETLVRWDHATIGTLYPVQFISLAEKTGLIVPLGEWVLREACTQLKKWQDQGFTDFNITVNVSTFQLQKMESFYEMVQKILKETGVPAENLEMEITETIFMENIEALFVIVEKLSDLGIKISIDDFGTGYSSMSVLKYLPVHTIKIDQSFLRNESDGVKNRAVIKSISGLAKDLRIKTVIEGIENEEQLALALKEGCHLLQGHYFFPPSSVEDVTAYINEKTILIT
ncbi:sensor domain-containing protein [Alkalicoccus halolimnae]|uniref:Bifunctional diguanylate cyclase/phosphodiesterase n=1 Tax=Alkalicoccus halolimnae TaxID=1667239 RepID=A0A5C7F632_9BACI|nr:bifunctional diguanylate cyclase/phosphodiesterase [Alkalicoccus halolimnae]TXF86142.1 GGDEF domain-containing protein [Alkalicoccus halolimnae]